MTKEEANSIIKAAWVRSLQKRTSIPEDISETYKAWVIGLTNRASAQLTQTQGAQQQAQGQAPEGATAPEQQESSGQEGQGQEQEEASS